MKLQIGVAAVAAALAVAAHGQTVHSLADDAAAFGARETNWAAELSPSGAQMLFLAAGKGTTTELDVQDLKSGEVTPLATSAGKPDSLQWCEFATETQIVCQFGGNTTNAQNQVFSFSRLVVLATDHKGVKPLGTRTTGYDEYIRQYDGDIVDWLPDQPGAVLMERNYVPQQDLGPTNLEDKREGLGVDRIDLTTLKAQSVEPPLARAADYLSDGHGHIRLMALQAPVGEQLTGITEYRYRRPGSNDWIKLGQYDENSGEGPIPLAVDAATDSLYCLKKLNGREALYAVSLDGSDAEKLIASNDRVDIDGVVRLDPGMPVIGYTYTDEREHTVYFDPEYRRLAAALSAALPQSPLIDFASTSADHQLLLLHASSDVDPGAYYLLDRKTHAMRPVLLSRPPLESRQLAPVQPVQYRAADGTMIPAFVTAAAGHARPGPAIVLPHGGPAARDEWRFDWLAQFLAARGYVVIQPNFRGSAGYGSAFEGENAIRDWQMAMSDIDDSAKYLVDKGLADPKRIAIVGWSYGGFAALLSAALHPDRYKAVVAIAPVTDLNAMKKEEAGFTDANLTKRMVGPKDNARQGSPIDRADEIRAPVLLVHGTLDGNVDYDQSKRMLAALQKAGDRADLLTFKDLDHQIDDSDARMQMLTRIGELLERTIGH